MLKDATTYNPAFQPYDFLRQQSDQIARLYTNKDPLYRLGGRFFQNVKVVPSKPTPLPALGTVGTLYEALKGHELANFEGAGLSGGQPKHSSLAKMVMKRDVAMGTKRQMKEDILREMLELYQEEADPVAREALRMEARRFAKTMNETVSGMLREFDREARALDREFFARTAPKTNGKGRKKGGVRASTLEKLDEFGETQPKMFKGGEEFIKSVTEVLRFLDSNEGLTEADRNALKKELANVRRKFQPLRDPKRWSDRKAHDEFTRVYTDLIQKIDERPLEGSGKVKGKTVTMPIGEFKKEHKRLVKALTPAAKELKEQKAEMKKYGLGKPPMRLVDAKGKTYRGDYHIMKDGSVHTGKTHTKRSSPLFVKE
jgi:hypothetical protein